MVFIVASVLDLCSFNMFLFRNFGVLHLLKRWLSHMSNLILFNMLLLSSYVDDVKDAEFRCIPPKSKVMAIDGYPLHVVIIDDYAWFKDWPLILLFGCSHRFVLEGRTCTYLCWPCFDDIPCFLGFGLFCSSMSLFCCSDLWDFVWNILCIVLIMKRNFIRQKKKNHANIINS